MKPVHELPGSMTVVDTVTGKETHEQMKWRLMPPASHKCQICATEHPPTEPHNAQSLYYQTAFNAMVGRAPTWADAIAHCGPEKQALWEVELKKRGAWSEPEHPDKPVKHHGVE